MTHPETHIEKLRLELTGYSPALLAVFLILAAVFSVWYYRNTVPPVSGWKRWVLVFLRTAVLTLILVVGAGPVVRYVMTIAETSKTAVICDTSSSMDIPYDLQRKDDALGTVERLRIRLGGDALFYGFDSILRRLDTAEPHFNGTGTDILAALTGALKEKDITSVVLVSDGRWNLGEDPAGKNLPLDVPVHTVTVGSSHRFTDVGVSAVSCPPVVRDGDLADVEVRLVSTRELDGQVPVEILEDDRAIMRAVVPFSGMTTAAVSLEIPSHGPGVHRFTAVIHPEIDENAVNNSRSFTVKVVKKSFRTLVAADKPSADLAFFLRALAPDDMFEHEVIVDKGISGGLNAPFPKDLSEYDVLVVLNWGGELLTADVQESVKKWIAGGKGALFLGSSPPQDHSGIVNILPVSSVVNQGTLEGRFSIQLTDAGKAHVITSAGGVRSDDWRSLPPLNSLLPVTAVSGRGQVLAASQMPFDHKTLLPAIAAGTWGSGKVAVIPASGIWRWRLMMEGAGKGGTFYDTFITTVMNWLTTFSEQSPLVVTTGQDTYLSGQDITLEARVYDDTYSPVSGADITLIFDRDLSKKALFTESKPGLYTASIRGIPSGGHTYRATAFFGGGRHAETEGSVRVEQFPLELLDPSPDPGLMKTIAERTGGLNVSPSGIDSILLHIKPRTSLERREKSLHFHLNPFLLVLIVLFLTVEWSVRKYRGMI